MVVIIWFLHISYYYNIEKNNTYYLGILRLFVTIFMFNNIQLDFNIGVPIHPG